MAQAEYKVMELEAYRGKPFRVPNGGGKIIAVLSSGFGNGGRVTLTVLVELP